MLTTNQLLIYKQRLNLDDATFSFISHTDSIVAIVYKVLTNDGKELVLKICDQAQHYFKELYFLKYFADKLPVAKVINTIKPEPGLHGAIFMEYLPGELLQKQQLTTDLSFKLGVLLAKIHLNRTTAFGDLTELSSMVQDSRKYFAVKFEESFSECKGHLSEAILSECWDYYQKNLDYLLSVDGPCIIHRDFRPGNIIVNKGIVSGIIDWASGRSGFVEDDLCPLEIGEWGTDSSIKQTFLDGYASIRRIPNYSAVMPLLLLNRAIATIGFTLKTSTWDNRDSELYKRYINIIEQILS